MGANCTKRQLERNGRGTPSPVSRGHGRTGSCAQDERCGRSAQRRSVDYGFQPDRRSGTADREHPGIRREVLRRGHRERHVREPRHPRRDRRGVPRRRVRLHGPARGMRRHPVRQAHAGPHDRNAVPPHRLHDAVHDRHAGHGRRRRVRHARAGVAGRRPVQQVGQAHRIARAFRAGRGLRQQGHEHLHEAPRRRHLHHERPEDLGHERRQHALHAGGVQGRAPGARQREHVAVAHPHRRARPVHRPARQDRPADHPVRRRVLRRGQAHRAWARRARAFCCS